MKNPVIIFGVNGIGKAALEIFKSNNILVYCFLDDNKNLHNTEIDEVTVLGSTDDEEYLKLIGKKCEAFVATDSNKERKAVVKILNTYCHVQPSNAVHQLASISPSAIITHGNFVNAQAYIGGHVKLGNHCLIHSGAIIDYECVVGNFVQVGAGSVINAGVEIDNEAFIGSGAVVVSGVKIGMGAKIGAGSVVIANVEAGQTVFGNPAKPI